MSTESTPQPGNNPWRLVRDEEVELSNEDDRSIRLELPHPETKNPAYVELAAYIQQRTLYLADINNADISLSRRDQVFLLRTIIDIMHKYGCETFGAITVNPSAANVLSFIADPTGKAIQTDGDGPTVTLAQLEDAAARVSRWL